MVQLLRSDLAGNAEVVLRIEQYSSDTVDAVLQSKVAVLNALQTQQQQHEAMCARQDSVLARPDAEHAALKSRVSEGLDSLDRNLSYTAKKNDEDRENWESRTRREENEDKARKIISSLRYPEMRSRRGAIETAYPNTYKWIFRAEKSIFRDWLHHGEGVFWLHGKADSGKSIAMKFLAGHESTRHLLRDWAAKH